MKCNINNKYQQRQIYNELTQILKRQGEEKAKEYIEALYEIHRKDQTNETDT